MNAYLLWEQDELVLVGRFIPFKRSDGMGSIPSTFTLMLYAQLAAILFSSQASQRVLAKGLPRNLLLNLFKTVARREDMKREVCVSGGL